MAMTQCEECGKDISDTVAACPHCGFDRKVEKKKKGMGCVSWFVIGLFALAIIGAISDPPNSKESTTSATRIDPAKAALANVKLEKFSWQLAGFGNVMVASFTLTNNNDHRVRDLRVECDLIAKSGTKIDQNTKVIYQVIEPKKSIRINEFNMGFAHSQAASAGCEVIGLTPN